MTLSIIIPVYNGERTIGRCIQSIYHQDINFDSIEVIIIDDCSTDNTLDIINSLASTPPN